NACRATTGGSPDPPVDPVAGSAVTGARSTHVESPRAVGASACRRIVPSTSAVGTTGSPRTFSNHTTATDDTDKPGVKNGAASNCGVAHHSSQLATTSRSPSPST